MISGRSGVRSKGKGLEGRRVDENLKELGWKEPECPFADHRHPSLISNDGSRANISVNVLADILTSFEAHAEGTREKVAASIGFFGGNTRSFSINQRVSISIS